MSYDAYKQVQKQYLYAYAIKFQYNYNIKGATMKNQKNISLKDSVYKQIVEMITTGELSADAIITESQMIEHFQVSKSPVREALIQLCHDDILTVIPRCGYQIVRITPQRIRDLIEMRLYLELSSLPKVMEHMTPERLACLKELNRERQNIVKTLWNAWNNNIRFHTMLVSFGDNQLVTNTVEHTLNTCLRAYVQLYNLRGSVITPNNENYHDVVTRALEEHNVFAAYEYLKKDILFMEQELLKADII